MSSLIAVDGNSVYILNETKIYAYNTSTFVWSQFPDSTFRGCALAVVDSLLTLIDGKGIPLPCGALLTSPISFLVLLGKGKLPSGLKNFHPCLPNDMECVQSALKWH